MRDYYLVYYDNGMEYSDYSWSAEFICLTEESAKQMVEKMNVDIQITKQMHQERELVIKEWDKNNPLPFYNKEDPYYTVKYNEWGKNRSIAIDKIYQDFSEKFNIRSNHPNDGSFHYMQLNGED